MAASTSRPGTETRGDPIPGVVRKNTFLMAAAQGCVGMGTQMVPTLGALMAVRLTGSAAFAGLGTSLLGTSRFLVAYPVGIFSDRFGRMPGMAVGLVIALMGAVLCGNSIIFRSFPIFVLGLLVFGSGMGAVQQLRVAAADMYPPNRRAEGIGLLLTGSLVGAWGGPALVSTATALAPDLSIDPLALSWLLVPIGQIIALLLVLAVRPDPRYIAAHMADFYPSYQSPPERAGEAEKTGFRVFIRHYPKLTAYVTAFAAQGNMSMMMAMTSYSLDHAGHGLQLISLAVALHVMGMFGFSLPFGKLADRFGREPMMMIGVLVAGSGSLLIVATPEYWIITLGTVLVGSGWSAATIASTALISDHSSASERGRAIGASDTFAAAAGIVCPLLGGPIADAFGLPIVGMFGMSLMVVPLVMQFRLARMNAVKA